MKIVKKNIKTAVLLYHDPDTGMNRRVMFGAHGELLNFFIDEAALVMKRLQGLAQADGKESAKKIVETKPAKKTDAAKFWEQDGTVINLAYEVVEERAGKK